MNFAAPELLLVLVIVIILFGVGRVARIGGEMGSAIRQFKVGLKGDDEAEEAGETTKS